MKIAVMIIRILLGLVFVIFGGNSFFHYIPTPPLPENVSGRFIGSLIESRYVMVIGGAQVLGGLLLIAGRFVPLGLAILGPVIVNILAYHLLMSREGISIAFLVALLWFFLFYAYREYFSGLFVQKAQPR